ncbi:MULTISPECIES: uracil-DNA glycosylase family protein [unclassified Clostridioides]|uniref:uracil-DNA glycosylase family protein n=1 Tax=unclassified Clostridioides TaxID=2635829 RepID=UPI001D124300|nr:uracil-DNA glycosylase family protein [Clostridioides sp. ZZV14-6150]MCC0662390.1 uracil-DNA glycosylase family protein [Clostridioides sp. ZZV14-6154]MCC0670365.1 uracil-DNA glycosylase family protein [Clostridioides sp. ZZV14-6153]MCC0724721.1 uracil-DNA glycosylase family protein [Clostridioides sp. ZZV14-6104]MCC0728953.1 uracil-DNA glycosylase family protein [Clostridioides sp. ZZV14-6045]MCC0732947.1 uracil-DNA glycosylase family protein [Clostridioides sp. ZZV14-6048]MCC0736855.1 ur
MKINIKSTLNEFIKNNNLFEDNEILSYLPNITIDTDSIKTIMINEVVPSNPNDDFYSLDEHADYLKTTIPLFQNAGTKISSINDILNLGIYITNAVKLPKTEYTITRDTIQSHMPILEKEIKLFSNLKVIMLMGDVAKKSFNMITKKHTKKNAVPSISTYKLRNSELYYDNLRIFPSYIMTGGNLLIEKSKFEMASEDIQKMIELIK